MTVDLINPCLVPCILSQHGPWCMQHGFIIDLLSHKDRQAMREFSMLHSGKICCFGETVIAYVKTSRKGAPTWLKEVWLSKTLNHDAHIISVNNSIVCIRSVRRLVNRWNADRCASVELGPWSFGLASLASQLVNAKHVVEPKPLTYPLVKTFTVAFFLARCCLGKVSGGARLQ